MTTASTMGRRRRWTLWGLMAVSAIGIVAFAVPPYLSGDPANSNLDINPDAAHHYLSLMVHAVPSGLALLIGPLQFLAPLRNRYLRLHRVAGRVYMVSVVIASVAALFAATFSVSGFPAQVAFYLLTAAWLYSLAQAYRCVRRGEVRLHRIWMIRNYALTFAAVTLRLYLVIGMVLRKQYTWLTFEDVYTASVWASILINVVVAEYVIVHRVVASSARRRQRRESASATSAVTSRSGGQDG
ncbi:DUF2306 domain-containing protein [Nonomuraea mesophila]|uniref:DUF2306 domain-containing protein n=1 Tax=Nonomuraea mesophila TaxID=2530382 RepID=A0A4R5ECB1_9ACTN|nr:DUF2306 domain-containing protein [Nonomuraea mesophila]TDE30905.1 DUF2306 domain-containing protein [Nonomuraea mesophila]